MKLMITLFVVIWFLSGNAPAYGQTRGQLDSLTRLLEKVSDDDQHTRSAWDTTIQRHGVNSPQFVELVTKMKYQDSIDMRIVGNVIDTYGWLGKEQISANANEALFLVIQHAPLPVQLKYLPVMKQAVAEKKARASSYALLLDRTNMYQGKLQVYGSQMNMDNQGYAHIYPIADEPNVDKRRADVGLPPMADYVKLFHTNFTYSLPVVDSYLDKIVIQGWTLDGKTAALAGVEVYRDNELVGRSDSSGFFRLLLAKEYKGSTIVFKKAGFRAYPFLVEKGDKEVFNPHIILEAQQ